MGINDGVISPMGTEHGYIQGSLWGSRDMLEDQSFHFRQQAIKTIVTQCEQKDFRKEGLIVCREQCFSHQGPLCVSLTYRKYLETDHSLT